MSERYDCIVLGLGGFGSAALYHAAKRGLSVLGIEQFGIAHSLGSSHGETRIIRKAYFEHPDYVPLLLRAYELWRELEAEQHKTLMHLCGLVLAGPPDGEAIAGAKLAARLHGVTLHDVSFTEARHRFPGFRVPDEFAVAHEPEAGYLEVENCVAAHVTAAIQHGANVTTDEVVREWTVESDAVRIRTSKAEYQAARLIVTAGPWASTMLSDLEISLSVVRKPQFWFAAPSSRFGIDARAPAFYFEMPYGDFYGFPSIDGVSVKVAEHSGGKPVTDPAKVDRSVHADDLRSLSRFLGECLPDVGLEPLRHSVCMYTLTADRHFVVDRHPQHEQVAVGAGFSGHGFKFTSVIGEALVDLVVEGRTNLPIGFLAAGREALHTAAGHSPTSIEIGQKHD